MNVESSMGVAENGLNRACESASKSMSRIAEGEIDIQDLQNISQSEVAVTANAKVIENLSDMYDTLLSAL